jgi:hypothetical protein
MSGSSDRALLRRLVDFERTLERDSSETVEEFGWGRLIHNPETAAMWTDNYLEVHSTELNADALVALGEEVQGSRSIEHRFVLPVHPAHGDRLLQGFEALDGWEIWRSLYMVRAREPDRAVAGAREVPRAAVEEVRRAVAEHDPDFTQEAVEQRLVRDARLDVVGNGRWFAAPHDGPPGASCVLYERDGIRAGRDGGHLARPPGAGPGERRGDGRGECLTGCGPRAHLHRGRRRRLALEAL